MTNLNQFHPFRASIDNSSSSNTEVKNEESKDKQDIEKAPILDWKTKLRLLVLGLAGIFLFFIISNVYSSVSPLLENFGTSGKKELSKKSMREEVYQASIYDKNDLNERGRSVDEARKKSGFFQGLFCKGGKRAWFCDN